MVALMSDGFILDTPEQIQMGRLITLKHALRLEIAGLRKSRGPSAYSIVKKELGFKGSREKVYDQLKEYIDKQTST